MLLALVAAIALAVHEHGGRWVAGASELGGFAGYFVVAGARAIPTMAAVRESADGSPGPAFLVVIAADAFLTLAVWASFVSLRAGDLHQGWATRTINRPSFVLVRSLPRAPG